MRNININKGKEALTPANEKPNNQSAKTPSNNNQRQNESLGSISSSENEDSESLSSLNLRKPK